MRYLDRAAVFFTAILPLLIFAGQAPADIAASLIAILFLVRSAITKDWSWARTRWVQLLLILWAYLVARNALLLPETGSLVRAAVWVRYPLFAAALFHWVLRDERARRWLTWTLSATIAALALDTLWQYHFGTDWFGREAVVSEGETRLTGPYGAPRVGVTILWLMFPAALWLMCHSLIRWRIAGLLLAMASAVAVFASGERMALLLMAMGFALCFLLQPRARAFIFAGGLAVAFAASAMIHLNPAIGARQIGETMRETKGFADSAYGRTWISALEVGKAHPLLGVGTKQFRVECEKPAYGPTDEHSLHLRCPMHPHNMYLEWLAEAGLIGLALFTAAMLALLWRAAQTWRLWWADPMVSALLATALIRLFPISVTTSQFISWSAVPFWLVIGWLAAEIALRDKQA